MKAVRTEEVPAQSVTDGGAREVTVRWLISRPEGAPNFAMRVFEIAPGGCTPQHEHAWEHEVYILAGETEVVGEAGATALAAGDAVLVLPGERHQFRNAGRTPARMLCMIPLPE